MMKTKKQMPLALPLLTQEAERSCSLALEQIMLEGGQASESNVEYMMERSKEKPTMDLSSLDEVPTFNADDLLGEENTARIILDMQVYTLRKTRQNKLLLTK